MGGFYGGLRLSTAERYDCETDQWSLIAPMNKKRTFASAAVLNGGCNETSSDLSTEKYDPAEDKWTEIPGMVIPSYCSKVEVIDDKILHAVSYHLLTELVRSSKNTPEDKFLHICLCKSQKSHRNSFDFGLCLIYVQQILSRTIFGRTNMF
ncbi:kelch-like protein 10 isoform X3 [Zootermopsis nevadensis]|uniref:kelch-like protein 10 isoform X3 n=1 Tax=Zootermopsis nevadensis TaxID=136037 RepID=UPI000B8EABB6|nr:kelch-like protein 10 isoform X3 [Zootermopsis nevadensis]